MNNSSPEPNHRGRHRPVDKSLAGQLQELGRACRQLRADVIRELRLRQLVAAAAQRPDMVALLLLVVAIAAGIGLIISSG